MASMPFQISRENRASLIDQVAGGLRHAITAGHYHSGDTLPNLNEMAAALGVSEIVTRRAVRRLAQEGLLNPRRGTGIAVCGADLKTWRGHVLYVHWSGAGMYYHAILSGVMAERLHAANLLVSAVHVDGVEAAAGYPKVLAELGHVITLAVIEGPTGGLEALFAARRIPFVHISDAASPAAVAAVTAERRAAVPPMRDHCRACGVRRVFQVAPGQCPTPDITTDFAAAGIAVETLCFAPIAGMESPEAVERGALVAMRRWLEGGQALPDLFWFTDDFVGRGCLLALTAAGVRIPEDVQVITMANKGLGPVYTKPLTRVEMDPKAHGGIVAACILGQLDKGNGSGAAVALTPEFIAGETTMPRHAARAGSLS